MRTNIHEKYTVVPDGVKAGKREHKPPGFWDSGPTLKVLKDYVLDKISAEEAMKELGIGNDKVALGYYAAREAKRLGILPAKPRRAM